MGKVVLAKFAGLVAAGKSCPFCDKEFPNTTGQEEGWTVCPSCGNTFFFLTELTPEEARLLEKLTAAQAERQSEGSLEIFFRELAGS